MKNVVFLLVCALVALVRAAPNAAAPKDASEVSVVLRMTNPEYIVGERVRAEVELRNGSPTAVVVGATDSTDHLLLELYRNDTRDQLSPNSDRPVTVPFVLQRGEAQRFEVFFDRHFVFAREGRYMARAVLVHDGMRYEGALRAFQIVPGIRISGALQRFADRSELRREFELVYWNRDRFEHLFLKVFDRGEEEVRWQTTDLGTLLRVTPPKLSIKDNGEVIVLHRASQDEFIRTDFWSLPDAFEFQTHDRMTDPDVAGSERIKSLYQESSGVEPVKRAWWKFW